MRSRGGGIELMRGNRWVEADNARVNEIERLRG